MQQSLTMEDLLELNDHEILTISQRLNLIWQFWTSCDDVAAAREIYGKTAQPHSTFVKLLNALKIGQIIELLDEVCDFDISRTTDENNLKMWQLSISNFPSVPNETLVTNELLPALWTLFKKVVSALPVYVQRNVILKYDDIDRIGDEAQYGVAVYPIPVELSKNESGNEEYFSDFLLEKQPDPITRLYNTSENGAYKEAMKYCNDEGLRIVAQL